jgi:hypothetical protein
MGCWWVRECRVAGVIGKKRQHSIPSLAEASLGCIETSIHTRMPDPDSQRSSLCPQVKPIDAKAVTDTDVTARIGSLE